MNKLNLPPFYIGQKVVYITGINMPKDSIHTVTAMNQGSCGCWGIGINGEPISKPKQTSAKNWRCNVCGSVFRKGDPRDELAGWAADSFAPIQEQNFPLMTFSKIVEKEKEEILINN